MNFYSLLLQTHDTVRWLILGAALVTLLKYFIGWFSLQNWTKADNIIGAVFTALIDVQLLTGILLYAVFSPVTQVAFADFGEAMKNADLRFYAVEHLTLMLIAIALVHIGRVKTKRAAGSRAKFGMSLLFFGIAYILILAGIPWQRMIGM